jgi:hypothetical protein
MSHRLFPAAAAVIALTAPVLAPPALAQDRSMDEMAAKMSDPQVQQAMAAAVASMSEALLEIPVAPFAKAARAMGKTMGGAEAADDLADIPPDATLRDLAGPEATRMPHEMARRLPPMMGAMSGMAGVFGAMRPMLEAMAERMKDAVEGVDGQDGHRHEP